jgi:CubicO group peptidase (beta-lactamase class C family)
LAQLLDFGFFLLSRGCRLFHPFILPDAATEVFFDLNPYPYLDYTAQEMYADLAEITLLNEPDKSYEYSNLGMGLLGHLLRLKTSKAYEKLLTEIICQPLGMTDTAIHLTPQQQ